MATPGELVRTLSESTRIEEATVAWHYRRLREAGLMTRGGRGRSAPKMTATDAANLLLACLSGSSGADVAEVVAALRSSRLLTSYFPSVNSPLECFNALPREHNLGEALDAVLAEMAMANNADATLSVFRFFGGYRTTISIWPSGDYEKRLEMEYEHFRIPVQKDYEPWKQARLKYGGRHVTEAVDAFVVAELVKCIANGARE